ncbi:MULTISPECIES: mobile element transfer protein [Streptomyces]|uniref:Mobile element transfer protein n=1 Tax=Streptomyces toxytricini TaxID=67369 RepID=A0ABW8ED07_STRT5|nr:MULTISPECIES: mobile element transfer protein [Streptomyces]MBD3576139.1 Mobile element transfer [Streptomyces sp. KD18]GGS97334.1 SpdB2 protein [Streptomyces toxytricini]
MSALDRFTSLMRIGPVQIGTYRDRRNGRTRHAAVCTAEDCGWSVANYASSTAAQLAARAHRCRIT